MTEPMTTIGGVKIFPDLTLAEMEPDAMLILPGGEVWNEGKTLQKLTA